MPLPLVCVLDDWDGLAASHPTLALLQEKARVKVVEDPSDGDLAEWLAQAEVVVPIRERRRIDSSFLDAAPKLRHIAQTGGGGAHLDWNAIEARGIEVSVTPGASATAVAEMVMCVTLAAERHLLETTTSLRNGVWHRPLGREISSLRIGVLGAGATGLEVARLASVMGANVQILSRRPEAVRRAGFRSVGREELFTSSDVVSVHLEATRETRGTIGEEELRLMRSDSGLVNFARASLVDQDALLSALEGGALSWAAIDVYTVEPPENDPLIAHPKVIPTPHLGWRTHETMARYLDRAFRNVLKFLANKEGE